MAGLSNRSSQNISIHALREEDDATETRTVLDKAISIHALREEDDQSGRDWPRTRQHFYPRPPRGGRLDGRKTAVNDCEFLSTPSARRATQESPLHIGDAVISIHALREEGDDEHIAMWIEAKQFLSTPSARRATGASRNECGDCAISIHALREEGDERGSGVHYRQRKFLSTPSARRATAFAKDIEIEQINFYPRPPRGGRLASAGTWARLMIDFYPRPPRGGRPVDKGVLCWVWIISIHALREEGDRSTPRLTSMLTYFYPRPPRGGRPVTK